MKGTRKGGDRCENITIKVKKGNKIIKYIRNIKIQIYDYIQLYKDYKDVYAYTYMQVYTNLRIHTIL